MTNLVVLPTGSIEIDEPEWDILIPDDESGENVKWREFAHREWMRTVTALRSRGTLSAENRHQIQRLVICYLRYDRATAEFLRMGLIVKAPKTGVPKVNILRGELRQAEHDAMKEEAELGLSPRRRGAVTKATNKKGVGTAADSYLSRPIRDK